MSETLYQENKKQYGKRATFYQVMSILILITWLFLLFFLILFQMHLLYGDVLIVIIFTFSLLIPANIYQLLFAFSHRKLIIKNDVIYPPKVPFKHITKKKNYSINYNDIIWFKVTTSPKGDIEGVLIKHLDFYIIDIHVPEFLIEAVMATVEQLRKNISQKEKILTKDIA